MSEWVWFCKHCRQTLEEGDDAIACDDAAECIRTDQWGGDACGYIICRYCRRPASDVSENVANRLKGGEP